MQKLIIIMESSKTWFCSSKFPWARERISSKFIDFGHSPSDNFAGPGIGFRNGQLVKRVCIARLLWNPHCSSQQKNNSCGWSGNCGFPVPEIAKNYTTDVPVRNTGYLCCAIWYGKDADNVLFLCRSFLSQPEIHSYSAVLLVPPRGVFWVEKIQSFTERILLFYINCGPWDITERKPFPP
jgi:hypothetical protein